MPNFFFTKNFPAFRATGFLIEFFLFAEFQFVILSSNNAICDLETFDFN